MRITEIFHSIQGEGIYMGIPMLFVRTNRCNLRCRWCDSTYTFTGGDEMPLQVLLDTVRQAREKWICFTGGEPLIQAEAEDFVHSVAEMGRSVLIETSGSIDISRYVFTPSVSIDMDVKTPSSGEEKSFRRKNLEFIRTNDYLKFVIADIVDYEFSKNFLVNVERDVNVVFQPAWGADAKFLVESVISDGLNVRVLPQFHKYVWGEIHGV